MTKDKDFGAERGATQRILFLVLGLLFLGTAFIGVFLPVLPTTPFLILATGCFARSSKRLYDWLLTHPRFGTLIQDWERYRVIPVSAKIVACSAMAASLAYLIWSETLPLWGVIGAGLIMAVGAVYVLSKPSRKPEMESGD